MSGRGQGTAATSRENWLDGFLFRQVATVPMAFFLFVLILFVAVCYAEPILDGDLFFHFEYARQMLASGSLRLDHTLYSWTPTSDEFQYCAWMSELLLYYVWARTGLSGIFAIRYLIVIAVLLLVWRFAKQRGVARTQMTALTLVVVTTLIGAGTLAKPEMFSLIFFTSIVFIYVTVRANMAGGGATGQAYYAAPIIVGIWANTHGAFILGAPFFAATAVGEVALYVSGSKARLSTRPLSHLLIAWSLCAVSTIITPYGIDLIVSQVRELVLQRVARPDARWNAAYRSILAAHAYGLLIWLMVMAVSISSVAVLAWRRNGRQTLAWLPLALATACYVPLYGAFLRSTQFLPVVLAFLTLALSHRRDPVTPETRLPGAIRSAWTGSWSRLLPACALAALEIVQSLVRPDPSGWVGFGIGTINPVMEAEFLARQKLGPNIYNVFDSGSYLLWRLYPQYKVMTDSRSFPYLSWFEDQYEFTTGSAFQSFIDKYPADVAVSDLAKHKQWRNFLKTKDWRLVFYGPTAAIFVKADELRHVAQTPADSDPMRFAALRSVGASMEVFEFATFIGDYRAANVVLNRMETALRWQVESAQITKVRAYRDAVRAVIAHDYANALNLFQNGLSGRSVSDRDTAVMKLLTALVRTPETLDDKARAGVIEALDRVVPRGFD
jgi:hypothetical protein